MHLLEDCPVDDRFVSGLVGEDPLGLGIPGQASLMTEGDVVDIDQYLLLRCRFQTASPV